MRKLEEKILGTEIVWNDNVADRGEWFELFSDSWHFMVDHITRFSVNYEDQYDWHRPAEYGVRVWVLSSLLEVLRAIPDKKIRIVFCYNYDYSGDETFDWKYSIEKKELIKILKKLLEEASNK